MRHWPWQDWEVAGRALGSVWAQTFPLMAGPVVVGFVSMHYSSLLGVRVQPL